MSVGNCTQPGKCPQAIRAIYNPQTGTYVVNPETKPVVYPQTQNPAEKPWDWGAIAKNTIMWTVGIGTAALLGIRTLGAIKNHEAGKQYVEGNRNKFTSLTHNNEHANSESQNLVSTLMFGDLFPKDKKLKTEDLRYGSFIGSSKSTLLTEEGKGSTSLSRIVEFSPLLKLGKGKDHHEYEGLEVPVFYHFEAGFRYLSNFFSGTKKTEVDIFLDHASSYLKRAPILKDLKTNSTNK